MSTVLWCARHELLLALRSRWLPLFAVVFAVLALLVASAGYVLSGGYGVQDFARTAASLVQLVMLLVPLTALSFGTLTLVSERGAAELLFAQPVRRSAILFGRYLGILAALSAAQAIGFGLSGLVVHGQAGSDGADGFLIVVAMSLTLTAVFLSIAALIAASAQSSRRARVLAIALVVWFVAVVLYDVAVLGAASLLRSGTASRVVMTATLINPVDIARTLALMGVEGSAAFGAASLALLRFAGGTATLAALGLASLAFWTIAPLALAARRLTHADV
jgi:Cu-processing system permease protein